MAAPMAAMRGGWMAESKGLLLVAKRAATLGYLKAGSMVLNSVGQKEHKRADSMVVLMDASKAE